MIVIGGKRKVMKWNEVKFQISRTFPRAPSIEEDGIPYHFDKVETPGVGPWISRYF